MSSLSRPDSCERLCVSCRQMRPRPLLLRLCRRAGGGVAVGSTRTFPGRGAYVCREVACYTLARKYRKLEKALRTGIDAGVWVEVESVLGFELTSG
ncbi:MAG: YlxR family protein [Candidatus Sericytochromatia bacterium]|nr:YlxR family protein [Candidatus Sericytochromatia bacterium]